MSMQAVAIQEHGGPELLVVSTVAVPVPQAGQVLVAVRAAGVNPVDTYIRAGTNNYSAKFPHTPGKDGAGVVEAVGEGVTHVKAGDRVYVAGTLTGTSAEKCISTAAQVHLLPARISFAQGACLGIPYGTAFRALFQRGQALPGETVLVHGASGAVGLAACQLASARGLRVVGTASTPKGRELVLANGASFVFDHTDPGHFEAIVQQTGPVNLVVEMLANVNLGKDLTILAKGARVVIVGSRGTVEINPRDLMSRDAQILGVALANVSPADMVSIHAGLQAGLAGGSLTPVVAHEVPLAEMARAHQQVMEPGAAGNVVVICA